MVFSHRQFKEIDAAVSSLKQHAHAWTGIGFRFASLSYAAPYKILSGHGSQLYGGRWNAIKTFPSVYCSLLPETAISESMHRFRCSGLKPRSPLPGILISIEIRLHRVIDLSNQNVCLGLSPFLRKAEKENWQQLQDSGREAMSQAIGRAVWQRGLEGILFSSAVIHTEKNLCIFPDNLHANSVLQIENESILQKYIHE